MRSIKHIYTCIYRKQNFNNVEFDSLINYISIDSTKLPDTSRLCSRNAHNASMNFSYSDFSHIVSRKSLLPPIIEFSNWSLEIVRIKSKLSELMEENSLSYNSILLVTFV